MTTNELREAAQLANRITQYLSGGGLFNPELANHDAVRDLLIDCRAALTAPTNEAAAQAAQPVQAQGGKWEGAEGWEPLAWALCAEEHGEEACNELIWEGGPIPEPWGDRWLKYEHEAKWLIELVRKHAPAPAVDRGLSEAATQALEAFTPAIEAIECLQYVRCHPKRHDLDREWLTRADKVIGYWESSHAAERISKARDALLDALAASAPSQAEPAMDGRVAVPVVWLRHLKDRVNTLATLSIKAERHALGAAIKQDIADELAAAPSQAGSCQASAEAWQHKTPRGWERCEREYFDHMVATGNGHCVRALYPAPPAGRTLTETAAEYAARNGLAATNEWCAGWDACRSILAASSTTAGERE